MEAGLVSLVKIVSTLVGAISVVPLLFLFLGGGDRSEPDATFDSVH